MDYRDLLFPKSQSTTSGDSIGAAVDNYLNNANMGTPIYTPNPSTPDISYAIDRALNSWATAMKHRDMLAQDDESKSPVSQQNAAPVEQVAPVVNDKSGQTALTNLKNAEQELQEARESDAQSGSEGYEAKPNGVFSRLKAYGNTLTSWGQKSNDLLKTMAQSPWSNFVDPTTVLGGQRTMVNDIDAYFNSRGLQGVKNDMLAQKRLDTELAKTKLGQFNDYMSRPPEEQAMYRQFAGYDRKTGTQGGYKTLQAAALDFPNVMAEEKGYMPSLDEVRQGFVDRYGIPYEEALRRPTGTGAGGVIRTPLQQAQREVVDLVNNGVPFSDAMQQVSDKTGFTHDELSGKKAPSSYQPQSPEEKLEVARLLKGQELDVKDFSDISKEIKDNAKNAATNAELGRSMHKVLDEATRNGITVTGGGDLGKALRRFGANFGLVDSKTGDIISSAEVISNAIFGNQIAQVIENQNRGNITEKERALFARQAVDLGASEEAMRLRLDLYILYNELALQAAKKLNSLSSIADPIIRKQAFEDWQTAQYEKTAKLVRAVVDSHMGVGYFDNKEAAY